MTAPERTAGRSGLTLLELLISMVLIASVVATATTAFVHMLNTTKRMQAIQAMDATAKAVYEKLNREVTTMHPCTAVWLLSTATGDVELVFMHGKLSPWDFPDTKHEKGVGRQMGYTDLSWTRWAWSASTRMLQISESRSARWFRVNASQTRDFWKIPSSSRMPNTYASSFLVVPQPQRLTGTPSVPDHPRDILNRNAWGSGESSDLGDYDDLLRNARPLLFDCSEVTIEVLTVDGSSITVDGTSARAWAVAGEFIDGRDHAGADQRPALVRLRFTLSESGSDATRTYSFSFAAPGITPY